MDDQLGHQRVVVRRHVGARAETRVDPHPGAGRRHPPRDAFGVGDELTQRILGVDPHLDRVSLPLDLGLREAQLESGRDADLFLHEIHAGHRLGDRMLHLEAGVDLQKVELAVAEDELDCAGVDVAGRGCGTDRSLAHGAADFRGHGRRRCLFHDLLMAALDRALTLAQVHGMSVGVADDLDLDMARVAHVALQVDRRVAKRRPGRLGGAFDRRRQLPFRLHDFHTDPAPAAGRFEHHRKPDLPRRLQRGRGLDRVAARRDRHTVLRRQPARRELRTKGAHRRSGRTDERDPGRMACLGELGLRREIRIQDGSRPRRSHAPP